MTGIYCKICGGNMSELIDSTCIFETCGFIKYPDILKIKYDNKNNNYYVDIIKTNEVIER